MSGSPTRSRASRPNPELYPADAGDRLHAQTGLNVGADEVRHNFERYGLLDDRVKFLVGWFKDTLPTAPIDQLAVMRLDGDMYESTIEAIEALYPKLSPGGFCIVDDYGSNASQAGAAVDDYRKAARDHRRDRADRRLRRLSGASPEARSLAELAEEETADYQQQADHAAPATGKPVGEHVAHLVRPVLSPLPAAVRLPPPRHES